jgi:hypothetical protein
LAAALELIPPQKPAAACREGGSLGENTHRPLRAGRTGKAGLKPAPEADAHALVRRISLDLTGLPPSPELLKTYVRPVGKV